MQKPIDDVLHLYERVNRRIQQIHLSVVPGSKDR